MKKEYGLFVRSTEQISSNFFFFILFFSLHLFWNSIGSFYSSIYAIHSFTHFWTHSIVILECFPTRIQLKLTKKQGPEDLQIMHALHSPSVWMYSVHYLSWIYDLNYSIKKRLVTWGQLLGFFQQSQWEKERERETDRVKEQTECSLLNWM